MQRILNTLAALLAVGVTSAAPAQTADPLDPALETVVTPTRLAQSLADVPAGVTVITAEMLQRFGIRSLPDALRLVPGMAVTRATGPDDRISFHGTNALSARRMNVLIDGISVYRPAFSEVIWSQLPISIGDVARIEVTRSPSSASYGPNSMLAVINIITRDPVDAPVLHAALTAASRGASEGLLRLGLHQGRTSVGISASRSVDRGFDSLSQDAAGHDSSVINRLGLRVHSRLGSAGDLAVNAMVSDGTAQVPFIDAFQQGYPDRGFTDAYLGGIWSHELTPRHTVRLSLDSARNSIRQSWRTCLPTASMVTQVHDLWRANPAYANAVLSGENPVGSGGSAQDDQLALRAIAALQALGPRALQPTCGTANQDAVQFRTDLALQSTYVASPVLRLVAGLGARYQGGDSQTYLGGRQTSRVHWAFGNVELRPAQWLTLNAGGYHEQSSLAPSSFSPRLGANWHLSPLQTLRFIWSTGTRSPDILEQRSNWTVTFRDLDPPLDGSTTARFYQSRIGNGGLVSERIASREIGYLVQVPRAGMVIDARVFDDSLTHLISERPGLAAGALSNSGSVTLRGAELQLSARLSPQSFGYVAYSYLDNRRASTVLERTLWSRHSGSLGLSHALPNGWQVALRASAESGDGYLQSSYGRQDLTASKSGLIGATAWRLTAGVRRLDDPVTTYSNGSETVLQGRFDRRLSGYVQLAVDIP